MNNGFVSKLGPVLCFERGIRVNINFGRALSKSVRPVCLSRSHAQCAILWPVVVMWPTCLQVIDLSRTNGLQNELATTFDSTSGSRQIHGTTLSISGHCYGYHSVESSQCVCAPPTRHDMRTGSAAKRGRKGYVPAAALLPHTISSAGSPCTHLQVGSPLPPSSARGQLAPSLIRGVQVGDRPAMHCPITNLK